jgi:hypothetical protein
MVFLTEFILSLFDHLQFGRTLNLFVMYIIKQNMGWVTTKSTDVTIGVKTFSITDLAKYYQGIHPYDSFHYRASRYLCTVGLEEVLRMPFYAKQADVDKVFFKAATESCEKFMLDWVSDWQEVYRQLSASKIMFREMIINGEYYSLTNKEYNSLLVEVSKIKTFFRILNLDGAVRMILTFSEVVIFRCSLYMERLPDVYPFALKGKPQTPLQAPPDGQENREN